MTGVPLHKWVALAVLLMGVSGSDAALAQTPLTLADTITRAQGDTADARARASAIDEANARIQRVQSGYWPRFDLTEVASLLLSRVTVPVLYFMSHRKRHTAARSVVPSPAGALP